VPKVRLYDTYLGGLRQSDLSTGMNRANPQWIEHNGSVKNRVNKHMFTLCINKLTLITMRGNGLLMVVGNPKRMRVLPCFLSGGKSNLDLWPWLSCLAVEFCCQGKSCGSNQ
jgi:hypothetical protein